MKKIINAIIAAVIIGSALTASTAQTPTAIDKPIVSKQDSKKITMTKQTGTIRHRMPSAEAATVDCWYDGQYIYVDVVGRDGDTQCELSLTADGGTQQYEATASELSQGVYVGSHPTFHVEILVYGLGLYTGDYNI